MIFLGTGDPLNEERAQTCLAVPLVAGETRLLDASGGTVLLRQLQDAGIALGGIRHLFVTHRHSTAAEAGDTTLAAGAGRLVLTHIRASRFANPGALAKEAASAFGHPVGGRTTSASSVSR